MTILTMLRLAALGAALLVALGGVFWAPPLLRGMEFFRVAQVEVAGLELLAPHEVLDASGIREGASVWDDPAPWIAAVEAHPAIRTATVERVLPSTLRLRVEERRPVALVEAPALRPATAAGDVLPIDPSRVALDLPLVRFRAEPGADSAAAAEARLLLAEVGRLGELAPWLLARASEVSAAGPGELRMLLAAPALELLLPSGADTPRLRRLRAVIEDLEARGVADGGDGPPAAATTHVDLRFADQVVVRLPSTS